MLDQFKATARLFANRQNKPKWRELGLDFPFTNLQLQTLDTDEKRNAFLTEILKTAEAQANDTFENADEAMILFFAAYYFVYGKFMSNFRKPKHHNIKANISSPFRYHSDMLENKDILFGITETAKIVSSTNAYCFVLDFALNTNGKDYILKPKEFSIEDMLAKINAPFIIDEVGESKKFFVFDGRRMANEPRIFLFDAICGHIDAIKMDNPKESRYEFDDNFMAYGKTRGTFNYLTVNSETSSLIFSKESGEKVALYKLDILDYDSIIEDKILECERFIFI